MPYYAEIILIVSIIWLYGANRKFQIIGYTNLQT